MAIVSTVAAGGIALQTKKVFDRYQEDEIMMASTPKRKFDDLRYVHEVLASLISYVYANEENKHLEIQLDSFGYELLDSDTRYDARLQFSDTRGLRLRVFRRIGNGVQPEGRDALLRVENNNNSRQKQDDSLVQWPKYIVAIRGTLISRPEDMLADCIIALELQCNKRSFYRRVVDLLEELHKEAPGPDGVWLAGHSLGAAIALVATLQLAKRGIILNLHLFNPPNISPSIVAKKFFEGAANGLADEARKIPGVGRILGSGIRGTSSLVIKAVKVTGRTAGKALAKGLYDKAAQEHETLRSQKYCPHVYVNPKDPVCKEYVEHFERRSPGVSLALPILKMFASCAESSYLVPQAYLHMNHWAKGPLHAHKLDQWWLYHPVDLKSKIVG